MLGCLPKFSVIGMPKLLTSLAQEERMRAARDPHGLAPDCQEIQGLLFHARRCENLITCLLAIFGYFINVCIP